LCTFWCTIVILYFFGYTLIVMLYTLKICMD
jgi:hypothetical protein